MNSPHPFSLLAFALAAIQPARAAEAPPPVTLDDYVLTGRYANGEVSFILSAKAKSPPTWADGEVTLLAGPVSLTAVGDSLTRRLELRNTGVVLKYGGWGDLKFELPFRARVGDADGWKTIEFTPAPANLRRLVLEGWPDAAKLELPDAAQPVRENGKLTVNLPGTGPVKLRWKDMPPETSGKLFFSADGLIQDVIAPGILRQTDQLTLRILQGKLERLELDLTGAGDVTRVDGPGLLNWSVEPGQEEGHRRIIVQLNAPRTGEYPLTVQTQATLPAFPATVAPPRISPIGALNYGGRVRVQNDGAVRLEVTDTHGLSQISAEIAAPPPPAPRAANPNAAPPPAPASSQAFAYRFADVNFAYTVHADNVLPEVEVNSIYTYHLGESDVRVDAEIFLDIREAPLRELDLTGPADWAVAGLEAANLADYFTTPLGEGRARLRLVFKSPISERQVVRLRLERNTALTGNTWALPPLVVERAKSSRGFIGATCDAGTRLSPGATDGLTEASPSTFPRKIDNLQAAWRFRDAPWSATLNVQRLAASVQADALQIFSVGEGLLYGSTVLNLNIAGAPVNVLRLQNTGNYHNVEFTGRDLRNWKLNGDTYEIYLNRPASGTYTLLATYELPFKANGDNLPFTGLRPLEVQSEQGYILVASGHPFNLQTGNVSTGLVRLETAEIPAEYRLLCDAPILASYQYSARPFSATLAIAPLAPGRTEDQVVDIAELDSRISATGEALTTAKYLLKSKGHDHLRLSLPAGVQVWAVSVNHRDVVPVTATGGMLIPLPRQGDPNVPLLVEIKYAAPAGQADRVTLTAPQLDAPALVTDWHLTADQDRRLRALDGAPVLAGPAANGLAWLGQIALGSGIPHWPAVHVGGVISPRQPVAFWTGIVAALLGVVLLRSARACHWFFKFAGALAGLVLIGTGAGLLALLGWQTADNLPAGGSGQELRLSIPVVDKGHALAYSFANEIAAKSTFVDEANPIVWLLAPGMLLIVWLRLRGRAPPVMLTLAGMLVFAGVLGLPHGPMWFCFALALALVQLGWRGLAALRFNGEYVPRLKPAVAAATVMTALLAGFSSFATMPLHAAATPPAPPPPKTGLVVSISQNGTVMDGFAHLHADVTWRAKDGDQITLLRTPAVLTSFNGSKDDLKLTQETSGDSINYLLTARDSSTLHFTFDYDVRARESSPGSAALTLPTPGGLVNDLALDLDKIDLEAGSDEAVSLRNTLGTANKPRVTASYPAGISPTVRWWPRARDLSVEKPVYYAEWQQLYAPAAGIVDGRHEVRVRLAQGEVKELVFTVPAGLTIAQVQADGLTTWRFDPDQHKLTTYFEPSRKATFSVLIRSQAATATLPYQTTLAPLRLEGAATDGGLLATATGQEVQVDSAEPTGLSTINLEDFPVRVVQAASTASDPLTTRKAYAYVDKPATLKLSAVAVSPDVRVFAHETLSLGEDRIVLAARLDVAVTRAGIFKLTFLLPKGMELESLSGPQLSHWTDLETPDGRLITLNLKGKIIGNAQFDLTLSGPGLTARQEWTMPRLTLREAAEQTGELALLPELGLRPHIITREGLTQFDPKQAGVNAEGALTFRLLQSDWNLSFDVEKIDPWIQVNGLQEVTVREGLTDVRAHLDYQIDNAGVRELRLQLPANAVGVRIAGALVSDSLPVENQAGQWLVHLQRRTLGQLPLEVSYQIMPVAGDNQVSLAGIQTLGTNLQRGYLALRSRGRLETRVATVPASLQATDWESLPLALRRGLDSSAASQVYRVVDPAFALVVNLDRHEAAKVLPARVVSTTLRSLASPTGQLLTAVVVQLHPGDKRNLRLKLPADAQFWFAFVNDKGVTPNLDGQDLLLPLEPNPMVNEPASVEFLYAQPQAAAGGWNHTALTGPSFDLPLQNITWQLFLPETWAVTGWSGPWQKIEVPAGASTVPGRDLQDYISSESSRLREQTVEAGKLLEAGNQFLKQGEQVKARDLFSTAYQISQHDAAFNEDARVQWQNLREQQAMMGLANRRNWFADNNNNSPSAAPNAAVNPVLGQTAVLNFTQQEARQLLGANAAEDNAVLARLASRLVQQQAATLPQPAAIRATLPERGQVFEFTQSLQINPTTALSLQLTAGPTVSPLWSGLAALGALTAALGSAAWMIRRPQQA